MKKPKYDFRKKLSASKSILDRLLVLRSFSPKLDIGGESTAEDVLYLKSVLASLAKGELLCEP